MRKWFDAAVECGRKVDEVAHTRAPCAAAASLQSQLQLVNYCTTASTFHLYFCTFIINSFVMCDWWILVSTIRKVRWNPLFLSFEPENESIKSTWQSFSISISKTSNSLNQSQLISFRLWANWLHNFYWQFVFTFNCFLLLFVCTKSK